MAEVWLLHEYVGETELFRAEAIEHLRSDRQQVVARRVGGDSYTTILHTSGRGELPDGFAVDLLVAIGEARRLHPAVDSVIAIREVPGHGWQLHCCPLSQYKPSA
ncbi:hypothetical protein ACIBEA_41365 [Streptomyces sp. NPDC051555]|uniref:hypothetical protein n=1 Tax=Streptomyces sp. NPDC051555 TaxID=3365657 RepID=UPI003790C3B9